MAEANTVAALRQKVDRYLRELFGSCDIDADGDFVIRAGSAVVWIRPIERPTDGVVVRIWSITNVGVRVDDELTKFIATENAKLLFGVLYLDESRPAVILSHSLLGEFLNRKELEVGVVAVAEAADDYGDRIKSRFGGVPFGES